MITVGEMDLVIGQTTVVTVCVALMVWLGLLGRPSRASLLWTLGFVLALLGSYGSIVTAATGINVLMHPSSIGLACGTPTLIWSGLRAMKGQRAYAWAGFVHAAASVAALWATTNTPSGLLVFRLVFALAALSAALGAVEVRRGVFAGSRFGIPLLVASATLVLLAVIGVAGAFSGLSSESSLFFVRGVLMATTVYLLCATVSLLFLANRRPGADDILEALDAFVPLPLLRAMVRERLLRARTRREQNWTFLDIRLDDAVDLREATGELAFAATVSRFEDIVVATFPADADLGRAGPGHVLVLLSQSSAAVRELVRSVLNATAADSGGTTATLRISASAGIATVDAATDTFETLRETAGRAAETSQLNGGDRWTRAEGSGATAR